jgi:hypothetical protein
MFYFLQTDYVKDLGRTLNNKLYKGKKSCPCA